MKTKDTKSKLTGALVSRSQAEVWEAAKEVWGSREAWVLPVLIRQLRNARKPLHRQAAGYALAGCAGKRAVGRAVGALELALGDEDENPKVRSQAAESLAYLSANRSVPLLTACLRDCSKDVRFWCAFELGVSGMLDRRQAASALPALRMLAQSDARVVRGFWSIADEALWAVAKLEGRKLDAEKIEQRLSRQIIAPHGDSKKKAR